MSDLSKEQKDELVTSYAALALYDGDVSSRRPQSIDCVIWEGKKGNGKLCWAAWSAVVLWCAD